MGRLKQSRSIREPEDLLLKKTFLRGKRKDLISWVIILNILLLDARYLGFFIKKGQRMKMTEQRLKEVIKNITPSNPKKAQEAQDRLDSLTKPAGSLGMLEKLAVQVSAITNTLHPSMQNKTIFTMAGDHGVVDEGVSAYPREVTPQMVYNFLSGGAGINVLARHVGAKVIVVDAGIASDVKDAPDLIIKKIAYGTANMTKGPAMTREQAISSILCGIEVIEQFRESGLDIVGTGDMGIGNTTPASAITAFICGQKPKDVTGYGTGIDERGFKNKVLAIVKAIEVNDPDARDGIDILSKIGGFEIGAIAGLILGAAANHIPVVIDGFISGAAALIAYTIEPLSKDYMIASHLSVEKGHKIMLEKIGLCPLLSLDMRLGEGTGAALGISLVDAAMKILNEMATFDQAGVAKKKD